MDVFESQGRLFEMVMVSDVINDLWLCSDR
jgi:hypothetical protein